MAIIHSDRHPHRYEFDDSVYRTPGAFYDIGCYRWEWLQPFMSKKPVVGVDPQETYQPAGCTLVRACLLPYAGNVVMHGAGLQSACGDGLNPYKVPFGYDFGRPENCKTGDFLIPAITWPQLVAEHGPAAMVKMNIEAAEIPILMTVDHPMAPQLIVAFHYREMDCSQPNWPTRKSVESCLLHLTQWYDITQTELTHTDDDRWFMCMAR